MKCPLTRFVERDCKGDLQYLHADKHSHDTAESRQLVIDFGCCECRHTYSLAIYQAEANEPARIFWKSRSPWKDWDCRKPKRPTTLDPPDKGLIEELF